MEYNNGYSSSLVHSQGAWKKHKYTGKVNKNGKVLYLYGNSNSAKEREQKARVNKDTINLKSKKELDAKMRKTAANREKEARIGGTLNVNKKTDPRIAEYAERYGGIRRDRNVKRPEKKEEPVKETKKIVPTDEKTGKAKKPKKEKAPKKTSAKGSSGGSKEKETKAKVEKQVEKKPEKVYTSIEGSNEKTKEYLKRYASKRKYSDEEVEKLKKKQRR